MLNLRFIFEMCPCVGTNLFVSEVTLDVQHPAQAHLLHVTRAVVVDGGLQALWNGMEGMYHY